VCPRGQRWPIYSKTGKESISEGSRDTKKDREDILVFIHGYNNDQKIVMQRHRQLKKDLQAVGFKGAVMSFDWPSADSELNTWKTGTMPRKRRCN
jgi:esterase/lipase superfamily enzyme